MHTSPGVGSRRRCIPTKPDYGREENNEPEGTQQERDETQPPAERGLPAEPEGDQEYRTSSGRVSKRPVRFGELTDR